MKYVLILWLCLFTIPCYAEAEKNQPYHSLKEEKKIILQKCSHYHLTAQDALIIEALRHLYYNSIEYKSGDLNDLYIRALCESFQADILKMIDWACVNFQIIHEEYDTLDQPVPIYTEYVFKYFHRLMAKKYSIGKEDDIPRAVITFVNIYINPEEYQ